MRGLLTAICLVTVVSCYAQEAMYNICPIKNSEEVPSATVFDQQGKVIDLKDYIGMDKVVLVFYRGGWCPYCTRHLSALQEVKAEIEALGFELIAVTPDDFTRLDSSVVRAGNIDYTLFSDKNVSAINAFGIGWKVNDELYTKYRDQYKMDTEWWSGAKHHVLPVPAVYVINKGTIAYQHVDPKYSQRLSPEILLSFLKSI